MTAPGHDVVVLGDALLDVSARPLEALRPGRDVPATIGLAPGGQGANLAVRLARQGMRVRLVCGLGSGLDAEMLREALRAEGVELLVVPVPKTGTVVIVIDERGERTMLSQRAPFAAGVPSVVPPDCDWIVVSGYLLLEPDGTRLASTVAGCRARRVLVGCALPNAATAARWIPAAAAMRPDFLVLNDAEAAEIEGGSAVATGIVVTGERLARGTIGGASAEARRPPDRPAIDTTGAGDAFAAALIASLARADWPPTATELEAALRDGMALASAVARTPGAQGSVLAERADTLRG